MFENDVEVLVEDVMFVVKVEGVGSKSIFKVIVVSEEENYFPAVVYLVEVVNVDDIEIIERIERKGR